MLKDFRTNMLANKEFSVSEISLKIKELLDANFNHVRVRGEISGLKIAASGHGYFNLKDSTNIIACTCWRPVLSRINFTLEDGMEIAVTGKISAYGPQSRYQFSVDIIEPTGVGAMMKIYEERKLKLTQEGIFDNKFKKNIALFPRKIGVITSITGAVIRDIIHRITDRCPVNIIIWPVTVQGVNAASEVISAIKGFNRLEGANRPDTLIIARGGGSVEDLWPFNDELMVRAAFASEIPLISAIGHESDFTLIDFVADLRAPTPTAAAEFATPVLSNLKYSLDIHQQRLISLSNQLLRYNWGLLDNYQRIFRQPMLNLFNRQQRLDELSFRLNDSLPNLLKFKHNTLKSFNIMSMGPRKLIDYKFLQIKHLGELLISLAGLKLIKQQENKLEIFASILLSLDYNKVLKRGYAMIKSQEGKLISSIEDASKVDNFDIKFFDGELTVKKL